MNIYATKRDLERVVATPALMAQGKLPNLNGKSLMQLLEDSYDVIVEMEGMMRVLSARLVDRMICESPLPGGRCDRCNGCRLYDVFLAAGVLHVPDDPDAPTLFDAIGAVA